jgi:hypothetical protein
LNKNEFKGLNIEMNGYSFELIELNDKFFFVEVKSNAGSSLFILNRNDNNNLFKYFTAHSDFWLIYNTEVCACSGNNVEDSNISFDIFSSDKKKLTCIKKERTDAERNVKYIFSMPNKNSAFYNGNANNLNFKFKHY